MRFLRTLTCVVFVALLFCVAVSHASPISDKYASLGGQSSFLGKPTGPEGNTPDGGTFRHYQHGSIYWSASTAAHEVHGLIHEKWAALGWEQSYLGYPMSDEMDTADGAGRVSKFQGGELIWSKTTNAISEVKSKDLIVDLPFPQGDAFAVIQANAVNPGDSHSGPWVYCYDFMRAGEPQPFSDGKPFASAATEKIVYVEQGFSGSNNPGNTIVQRLGEGRYASYMHLRTGSYSTHFGHVSPGGLSFLPQTLPWQDRPTAKSGVTLAVMSFVGAPAGHYHLHFCITTKPDRPQFQPFESVPLSFQNYLLSRNSGASWTHVNVGIPKLGDWMKRDSPQEASPKVASSKTIDFGTVEGEVTVAGPGKPAGPGKLTITVSSDWGEPLRSVTVNVPGKNLGGPWAFTINDVPAFSNLTVGAGFDGPWSMGLGGGNIGGGSAKFDLAPYGTKKNVQVPLKATALK
jgi:hypothetical protein